MGYIKNFYYFLHDIWKSRWLIIELTKKDFQSRYLGSYLGILWAFIQPFITVLIFWFVFQVGFKSMPVDNFPFILWLVAGLVPWFFISDGVASATNSITENSYLVKKVVFRVSVLPIIKLMSALVIHAFFICVIFIMYLIYGYKPTIYSIQILYYLFASIVLVLGISWITSSLVVFLKDVGQVVAMLIQFCFWITPIFWTIKMVPEQYKLIILVNPLYYIIEGYRNSLIYHKWFWEDGFLMGYFWTFTLIVFVIGAIMFKKLRPHFADVL